MRSADHNEEHKFVGRARNPLILAAFNDYLISKRSCSPLTLESYSLALRRFQQFLSEERKKSLLQVKRRDVRTFLARRRANGIGQRTQAHDVSVLRHFYRFLLRGNYSRRNPIARIECPAQPKQAPTTFDKTAIELIVGEKPSPTDVEIKSTLAVRNRAIVAALYAAGLRPSELLALRLQDLTLVTDPGFVAVRGAGKRSRICALDEQSTTALRAYVAMRELLSPCSDTLFIGHRGESLTRQRVWQLVRCVSEEAGNRVTPMVLRHSRALHMIENGAELRDVQTFLGYADVKNAKPYALIALNKGVRCPAVGNLDTRSRRPAEYEDLLLLFAKHLEHRDPPLCFNSITFYQSDVRLFITYLRRQGASVFPPPAELECSFLDSLRVRPDTLRRKSTALKYFRQFLLTLPWSQPAMDLLRARTPRQPLVGSQPPVRTAEAPRCVHEAVEQFLAAMSSKATLLAYRSDLHRFLGECPNGANVRQAADFVQSFVDQQVDDRKYKLSSLSRLVAALRSFFHWAHESGDIDKTPTIQFAGTNTKDKQRLLLSSERLEHAIEYFDQHACSRDAAIIHLLYEGLTPAEIVSLEVRDFARDSSGIVVSGRKQRQRYVQLNASAVRELEDLMRDRAHRTGTDAPLITNARGVRLTTRSIGRIVGKFAETTDLPPDIHPLTLREVGAQTRRNDPHYLKYRLGLAGAAASSRYLRN